MHGLNKLHPIIAQAAAKKNPFLYLIFAMLFMQLRGVQSIEKAEALMVDIGQIQQEMVLKSCNWLLFINL